MMNTVRFLLTELIELVEKGAKVDMIVTAVRLPSGSIELIVNHDNLVDKANYLLNAYDDGMRLKSNTEISIVDCMVIYK